MTWWSGETYIARTLDARNLDSARGIVLDGSRDVLEGALERDLDGC